LSVQRRRYSGLFNTLNPLGCKGRDFSLGTWNARSLFCGDFSKLKRKVKILSKHLRSRDIFCVQETRGNWANILKHLRLILKDFWAFASFGDSYGGIITFVSKQFCPLEEHISDTVLCVGRAHRISIKGPDCTLNVWNIHNFELHGLTWDNLCASVDADIKQSKESPYSFSTFVTGDFNETPSNCKKFEYGQPCTYLDESEAPEAAPRQRSSKLLKILEKSTEITATTPTRYQKATDTGVILDRVFTTIPPSILILCKVSLNVEQEPKQLYTSGISDHAPTAARFGFKSCYSNEDGPIPPEFTKHFLFRHYLAYYIWEEKLGDLYFETPFDKLKYLKNIMRAASILVREYMQGMDSRNPVVLSQTLSTIARTVWNQSPTLFETLQTHSVVARKYLKQSDNGRFYISNPIDFAATVDAANSALLDNRALAISGISGKESKMRKLASLARLWLPMVKTMVLNAVKVDANIVRQEPEKSIAMGEAWQPTYNLKKLNEQEADTFLEHLGDIGCFSENTEPPELYNYGKTIFSMGDSQPGTDGLPYSAWKAAGGHGVKALHNCDKSLRQGVLPPPDFNESSAIFVPKGSQPHDPVEVIREPLQTRPLSLKNTDNKIIVATNVKSLEPQYKQITHRCQNGFVGGRNFLNNLLDLDSAGRIYSMKYHSECSNRNPSNIPVLPTYDFEAAFPHVKQAWVWKVLKHRRLPDDYIHLFQGIYHMASGVVRHNNAFITILLYLSGVLQGCPGSAFLFNNALDPFLALMEARLREGNVVKGIVRGCADDIGACLSRLKHLNILAPIFDSASSLAGLNLKASKCVLVPLCQLSDRVKQDITKWLRRNIPQWAEFKVESSANLLGLYVGPGASKQNWHKQLCKIKDRVKAIQNGAATITLNSIAYNSRVVPVTSYVAQLLPSPPSLPPIERASMHTVLRLPQNSLTHSDLLNLQDAGGPKLRSISAACASALIRTAIKTIHGWKGWLVQLNTAADFLLPLHPDIRDKLSPPFWDSPPIALTLSQAAQGLPHHPKWDISESDIIKKLQTCRLDKVPVQKLVYKELVSHQFNSPIQDIFCKRLTDAFSPYVLDFNHSIRLHDCFGCLKKSGSAVAVKVIKGWCNGWATSKRYQEKIKLPCLFGCHKEKDDLFHYLQCPHLYALWSFLCGYVHSDPLIRWGLVMPCTDGMLQIACVFHGYHAIRRHFKQKGEVFMHDQEILAGPQLRAAWTVFADAFCVEASEFSVNFRKFSVPSFLEYLNGALPSCLMDSNH